MMAFTSQIKPLKHGQLRLAVKFVQHERRLELSVANGTEPNVIISLQLDLMCYQERKNARNRLVRVLGFLCCVGGVTGVPQGLQPEFYLYKKEEEGPIFTFVFSRLNHILIVNRPVDTVDKKRKAPLVSTVDSAGKIHHGAAADIVYCFQLNHYAHIAAPLGQVNLQLTTGDSSTHWIRLRMDILLRDQIPCNIRRHGACTSHPREIRGLPNDNGAVVVYVDGNIYGDDTGGDKKEALGMRVQQALGAHAVQLRATYMHMEGRVLEYLPVDLRHCRSVQEVEARLPQKLSTKFSTLRPEREAPTSTLLTLPTPTCLLALSFVGCRAPFRGVARECSTIITEDSRTLIIWKRLAGKEGAGASLMARCPDLRTLILRCRYGLRELGRFLAGGWSLPGLRALHIQAWNSTESWEDARQLTNVVNGLCCMDVRRLSELKVRLTGDVVQTNEHAATQLARFVRHIPHLSTLEVSGFIPVVLGLRTSEVADLTDALPGQTLRDISLDLDCRTKSLGMPVDRILAKAPSLVSLTLHWLFIAERGLVDDPARRMLGRELCKQGIGMLAEALPSLTRLKTLRLMALVQGLLPISPIMPVFMALTASPKVRLHTLDLMFVAWDGDSFSQLVRSGHLEELEHLRMSMCELHFTDLFRIFRDAVVPSGRSLLPRLARLEVRNNPLLTPMEAEKDGIGVLPSSPITLPPRLCSIDAKTDSFQKSQALIVYIQQVFPSATVTI